jgi:hypothetical protein
VTPGGVDVVVGAGHSARRRFVEDIVFDSILARVGVLLVVTGIAFILMGWLGAVGPLVVLIGSGCAAIGLEHQLSAADGERPVVTGGDAHAGDVTRAA